jgi:hypothetical protein
MCSGGRVYGERSGVQYSCMCSGSRVYGECMVSVS